MRENVNPYESPREGAAEIVRESILSRRLSASECARKLLLVCAAAAAGPTMLCRLFYRTGGTFVIDVPLRILVVFLPALLCSALLLLFGSKGYRRTACVFLAVVFAMATGFVPMPTFIVLGQLDETLPGTQPGEIIVFASAALVALVVLVTIALIVASRNHRRYVQAIDAEDGSIDSR